MRGGAGRTPIQIVGRLFSVIIRATATLVAVAMSGFVWGLHSRAKVNPDLLRTTGHGNLAAFPAPSAAPPDLNELVRLSIVFIRK